MSYIHRNLTVILGVFLLVTAQTGAASAQETLQEKADLWGRMHGAAIFCRVGNAHDFGVKAMAYFQRRVGGAALEDLKQIYGIKMIHSAKIAPSGKVGNGCGPFRRNFEQVYTMLKS